MLRILLYIQRELHSTLRPIPSTENIHRILTILLLIDLVLLYFWGLLFLCKGDLWFLFLISEWKERLAYRNSLLPLVTVISYQLRTAVQADFHQDNTQPFDMQNNMAT